MTKFAEMVYIVHRRDSLRAEKILQDRALSEPKIKLVWDSIPEKIEGDEKGVTSLRVKNVKTGEFSSLEVEGVFIYVGFDPNTEFLAGTANLDENNYILTDENMATSAPGIFAAGDMRAKITKQIATAVGDGAIAAIAAEKYIEDNFKK